MKTFVQNKIAVKFKLAFTDGTSFSFTKIKLDATDDAVYNTAYAIALMQDRVTDTIYKLTDTELYYQVA